MKKINFTKITRSIKVVNHSVAKNSPLLLTIAGVIGLGATAYLTYKSAGKVAKITDDLEATRNKEEQILDLQNIPDPTDEEKEALETLEKDFTPIKRTEVVRHIAGAVAAPVLVGSLSICSIALSYYILNNRVLNLAASLATATAQNAYFEKKFKRDYGDEEYTKFSQPSHEEEMIVKDEKGKETKKHVKLQDRDMNLTGEYFDHSTEYASDDHAYNQQFIASKEQVLQERLFRNGWLFLNEVRDELGFERTRDGAMIGWTAADSFNLVQRPGRFVDPTTGELKPQIFVAWNKPHYIYDDVEYKDILGYGL